MSTIKATKVGIKQTERRVVEGRKSIAVHEVDNGHTGEVIALVNKLMLAYRDVPDFTYSIDVWTEADDALKMLE